MAEAGDSHWFEVPLGTTCDGSTVFERLSEVPALLVTGTTGSGKSSFVKTLATELMVGQGPKELRFAIFDSSRVSYACLQYAPYMFCPITRDTWEFERLMRLIASESERRLILKDRMDKAGLGHLFVIVDDFAAACPSDETVAAVERCLQNARLTQIHFVFVTSTPTSRVLTPSLLSNIDRRISFRVTSRAESKRVLGCTDASKLGIPGEMIVRRVSSCVQCSAAHLDDEKILEASLELAKKYEEVESPLITDIDYGGQATAGADHECGLDPLIDEAARVVIEIRLGSTSGLQRRLKISYRRAVRLMDMLEEKGIVGPQNGSRPRDVLVDSLDGH